MSEMQTSNTCCTETPCQWDSHPCDRKTVSNNIALVRRVALYCAISNDEADHLLVEAKELLGK